MKRSLLCLCILVFLSSSISLNALAFQDATGQAVQEAGKKIAFQGTLYENGEPVTGERNFTFSIEIDENTTWTETQENVSIVEGLYSVVLGSVTPITKDLFYGVNERELSIKLGSTELGRTKLFSPFSPEDISTADDLPRRVDLGNEDIDSDTVFFFQITADNLTQGSQKGLQVDMTGVGFKMALRGNTKSQAGDASGAIAVIGSATGEGTGTHEGVRGQAFGAGKFNSGILGLAGGSGNGGTGYEGDGSYNTGVVGYGQNNAWGNTGVTGYAVGTQGEDNVGVVGIANVRADENDTERNNTGVVARANGLGYNKALFARAENGVENWAGWFEGDVAIQEGNALFINGPQGNKRVELSYFDQNDAGSILTYNHKSGRSTLIGSASDRTGALINLYDSLQNNIIELRATSRPGDWPADKRAHGQLSLNGPGGQNFYLGAKVWEEGGTDRPAFQMFGSPVDDGNGNTGTPEILFMTSNDFGDGKQQALIQLGKEGESAAILNRDNTKQLLNLVEGQGKYRFETNEQNSGVLKLMSAVDSVNVLIDSNGEKAGLIQLNDSLGRENLKLLSYPGGAGYMVMSAGAENIGENRVTAQYWGGTTPYINLIGRDADGNATGRTQMVTQGDPTIRITDANSRWLATLRGSAQNGGDLILEGPTTSNFWLGQKNWENSDLPFFAMRGQNTVPEGEGTRIPDGVSLEVSRYGDGSDVGVLTLRRIVNDQEETANLDFFQLNKLVNPSEFVINDVNGNQAVSIRRRTGDGFFGMAQFNNNNNEMRAEIGSFGDNSGFMQLYAPNGGKNIQMGGSDGNRDMGMLRLSGSSENNLINLEIVKDAANTEFGTVQFRNSNDGGFEIGSRSWENDNQGGLLTYTAVRSTVDVDNGNGGTYRPWLVSQEFHQDANGNQYGQIGVNSTNNGGSISINPGNSGNIDISGSLNQSSDIRLKKNISTLTSGLAMVNKLRGVRFNWKDDSAGEDKIGFIAQEVEEVLPELVKTRENGFKGVNYAEMTAVLVEAVKELSKQIEELKSENASLKAEASKVQSLEERLSKIEALLINPSTANADQK